MRTVPFATNAARGQSETRTQATSRARAGAHVQAVPQAPQRTKSKYIPAIDGLRAFAVLIVIFYHMGLSWAPGGLMGVTVFFVISGYLITGLLVAEYRDTRRIDLKAFWLRRAKRLIPAVATVIVAVAALCTLFNHGLLDKMRPDILPSLLFFNNWWQIIHEVSYFDALGAPSPLTHFWSLGIEEQFYIVWPLLLLFLFRRKTSSKVVRRGILVLAMLSAVEMALLYSPTGDPSRVYYGTDTRAFSLLFGAWLAFVLPSVAFCDGEGGQPLRIPSPLADVGGVVAFAGLVAIVLLSNGMSPFPYYGGTVLVTVLSGALIASLVNPEGVIPRIAGCLPLVWVGKRSYGMYLWHYPLILLTNFGMDAATTPWWMRLVQLALILVVSDLSYRFIEDPIRKGKLGAFVRDIRTGARDMHSSPRRRAIPAICVAAVCLVSVGGIILVPHTTADPDNAYLLQTQEDASQRSEALGEAQAVEVTAEAKPVENEIGQPVNEGGLPIYTPLLIGDSVAAGCVDDFMAAFPYGANDSVVSRNIWESPYTSYSDAAQVGDVVLFALGTNNALEDFQIDEMLAPVDATKRVFIINSRAPTEFCEASNAVLAAGAARYPNATLIDWYGYSAGHDEWFYDDGIHLNGEGRAAYVELIKSARPGLSEEQTANVARKQQEAAAAAAEAASGEQAESAEAA